MWYERTREEWSAALDLVADALLDDSQWIGPPVDAAAIAARLKVMVAYDRRQTTRGRHVRLAGRPSIFLRPEERPERLHWTIAHELGESVAYRVFHHLNIDAAEIQPAEREETANRLAARLLLPSRWFWQDVRREDGDLWRLKEIYETASCESIAWRLLDSEQPTIMTLFDQGCLVRRRANGRAAPALQPVEHAVWQILHEEGRRHTAQQAGMRVQGWPIHESGWRREFLRTTFLDAE